MSARPERRRRLLPFAKTKIAITDTDLRCILETLPVKFRKNKETLLRHEIEQAIERLLLGYVYSPPPPSALVEQVVQIGSYAGDLANKLSVGRARAVKTEFSAHLRDGTELRMDLGFGSVPDSLADVLTPYVARDLHHEGQYAAYVQRIGHLFGVADPSYKHLDLILDSLVLLSKWCGEAAANIREGRDPASCHGKVAGRQHKSAIAIALLEALAEIWKRLTGIPAVDSAQSNISGEVKGDFANFARVVGRLCKVPISDHLIRARLTIWRSK